MPTIGSGYCCDEVRRLGRQLRMTEHQAQAIVHAENCEQ